MKGEGETNSHAQYAAVSSWCLFNDAVSSSDYIVSNGRMISE